MATLIRNPKQPLPRASGNLEPIGAYLKNQDGSAYNLTGASVVFRMIDSLDGTVVVNNQAATVLDIPTAKVQYSPSGTETTLRGSAIRARYEMYWIVQKGGQPDVRIPYDGGFELVLFQEGSTA